MARSHGVAKPRLCIACTIWSLEDTARAGCTGVGTYRSGSEGCAAWLGLGRRLAAALVCVSAAPESQLMMDQGSELSPPACRCRYRLTIMVCRRVAGICRQVVLEWHSFCCYRLALPSASDTRDLAFQGLLFMTPVRSVHGILRTRVPLAVQSLSGCPRTSSGFGTPLLCRTSAHLAARAGSRAAGRFLL